MKTTDDFPGRTSIADLQRAVFGAAPAPGREPTWIALAHHDAHGTCVAGLEWAALRLRLGGRPADATGLRLVAVAESHRGRGLFRRLMEDVLAVCDRERAGPILLYAELPSLYTRFGFEPLPEHAFVGPRPKASEATAAHRVTPPEAERLLDRLLPIRTPLSDRCALLGTGDLLRAALREAHYEAAHLPECDALVVYEREADEFVVVDVVAAHMPSLARIVAALAPDAPRIRTLFPPDRLGWQGTPEPDDTGLMIRGTVPAAMRQPFMLPPTTAF